MFEWTRECLFLCIHPVTNRSALHDDDRMMTVLASDSLRQAHDEASLRLPRYGLETVGRKVMAFVHDDVSVVGDAVIDDTLLDQALDDGDIDDSGRLGAPTADGADRLDRQAEEG